MQADQLPPVVPHTQTPKKERLATRIKGWIHKHPKEALFYGIISGIGILAIVTIVVAALLPQASPSSLKVNSLKKPVPIVYYSPLTGTKVDSEAITKQAVTGIMIENSPDARPQSGLKQAGIIYEAIAEGGITRFLALYQEAKPQLIGPVRSVRMYYVDWVAPYNASVAHIGGSAAALAEVRNGNYRDIDQFFNAGSYWRATDRYAPHNVYTSFQKLDALNAAKGYSQSAFTGWPRQDGKAAETPNATSIAINFSSALFNTQYDYDAATNSYLRSIAGAPSTDREEGQVTPKVVIAMKVAMSLVREDGDRESITTSGSGEATVFQNGTATNVTWKKLNRGAPLQFFSTDGKEVVLNRGQTWVAAIPTSGGSVTWQ